MGQSWKPGFLNSISIHLQFKGCDQKKQDIEKKPTKVTLERSDGIQVSLYLYLYRSKSVCIYLRPSISTPCMYLFVSVETLAIYSQ